MNAKNPLTLWVIVGVCFAVIIIIWIPIAFQKASDMFGTLFEQTKDTGESAKNLWESQGKQQLDSLMRQLSMGASTTEGNQIISNFSENLKTQLLGNASSSATTSLEYEKKE